MNFRQGQRVYVVANTKKHHYFQRNEEVTVIRTDKNGCQVTNQKQTAWVPFSDISKVEVTKGGQSK